jgi:hypothetical protein
MTDSNTRGVNHVMLKDNPLEVVDIEMNGDEKKKKGGGIKRAVLSRTYDMKGREKREEGEGDLGR